VREESSSAPRKGRLSYITGSLLIIKISAVDRDGSNTPGSISLIAAVCLSRLLEVYQVPATLESTTSAPLSEPEGIQSALEGTNLLPVRCRVSLCLWRQTYVVLTYLAGTGELSRNDLLKALRSPRTRRGCEHAGGRGRGRRTDLQKRGRMMKNNSRGCFKLVHTDKDVVTSVPEKVRIFT